MGRRVVDLDAKAAPLAAVDEFEPAIVRSLGPLGVRRVVRARLHRNGVLRRDVRRPARVDARAFVDALAVASLRPGVARTEVARLGPTARRRLIRALVDVNGVERPYRKLYGSHLSLDERLLACFVWRQRSLRAADSRSDPLTEALRRQRRDAERILARADAYAIPAARLAELQRAADPMIAPLVSPPGGLLAVSKALSGLPVLSTQIQSSLLVPQTVLGSISARTAAASLASSGVIDAMSSAARVANDAATSSVGLQTTIRGVAASFEASSPLLAPVSGGALSELARALSGQPATAALAGAFDGTAMPAVLGSLGGLERIDGLLGVPSRLREAVRRRAAQVRAAFRGNLLVVLLDLEEDDALIDVETADAAALEEAVFFALEVMLSDSRLPERVVEICDATPVMHPDVRARIKHGLAHAGRALVSASCADAAEEWVIAQSLLLLAVESLMYSELELSGRATSKGGKLLMAGQSNRYVSSAKPAAEALLCGTEHEHLLDGLGPLLWRDRADPIRHGRSWLDDPRRVALRSFVAILALLVRYERDAVATLVRTEMGPIETRQRPVPVGAG